MHTQNFSMGKWNEERSWTEKKKGAEKIKNSVEPVSSPFCGHSNDDSESASFPSLHHLYSIEDQTIEICFCISHFSHGAIHRTQIFIHLLSVGWQRIRKELEHHAHKQKCSCAIKRGFFPYLAGHKM